MNLRLQKSLALMGRRVARKTADKERRAQNLPRRPSASPYIGFDKTLIDGATKLARTLEGEHNEYVPVPDLTPYVDPFDVQQERLAKFEKNTKPTVGAEQLNLFFAEAAE